MSLRLVKFRTGRTFDPPMQVTIYNFMYNAILNLTHYLLSFCWVKFGLSPHPSTPLQCDATVLLLSLHMTEHHWVSLSLWPEVTQDHYTMSLLYRLCSLECAFVKGLGGKFTDCWMLYVWGKCEDMKKFNVCQISESNDQLIILRNIPCYIYRELYVYITTKIKILYTYVMHSLAGQTHSRRESGQRDYVMHMVTYNAPFCTVFLGDAVALAYHPHISQTETFRDPSAQLL